MPIDNTRNGMSNAGFSPALNGPNPSAAFFSPPERINKVDERLNQLRGIYFYEFPMDMPKYYTVLNIMEYSRTNMSRLGQMAQTDTIRLPLPLSLQDHHSVTYQQENVGMILGTILNQANGVPAELPSIGQIGKQLKSIYEAGKGVVQDPAEALKQFYNSEAGDTLKDLGVAIAGETAGRVFPGAEAAAKAFLNYSPNQFLTILLQGPQYKTFNLQWSLTPKTDSEARQINKIIRLINNSMAPGLGAGGALFRWPKIFNVDLMPNSEMLMKFKPAVLQHFQVDYSGGGQMAFYRPSAITKDQGTPESVTLTMSFLELEFWITGDFKDNNNPRDVHR